MTPRWRLAGLVAICCVLLAPVPIRAGEDKDFDVQILAIRATTANSEVSPELKDLAEKLSKQFKYTGFKLEKKAAGQAKIDKAFEAELIENYSAEVTPRELKDDRVKMNLKVTRREDGKPKTKLKTDLTTERGKFVLVGVEKLGKDEFLIIAAAVR
ncbi:MAG: hypothetical protein JNG88_08535 [Phycisphaerales bacterium]|nr:hypothetical protein [Phycisphaerales bacterium]